MDRSELLNTEELSIGLATQPPEVLLTPNIGVIGVGGAGGNAINNMLMSDLSGVNFFAANTDAQALSKSLVTERIQLGVSITKGLGAGANPDVGKAAAQEAAEKIKECLKGLHLLFITAGMGGGTGTGAAPVIAQIAKEMNILTVGVVSKPFRFEGARRMRVADEGLAELQKRVDTLIVIPNQNLFRIAGDKMTFAEAFKIADNVLCQGVRSVTDLVMNPGLINLDFADVRTVLTSMGRAMMGTGEASGDDRATQAVEKAISNPLLDYANVKGAQSVLINVSGGLDLTLTEVDIVTERIVAELDPNATIIFGATMNEELQGRIRVSLVATGIQSGSSEKPAEPAADAAPGAAADEDPPAEEPAEQQPELIETEPVKKEAEQFVSSVFEHISVDLAVDLETPPEHAEPPLFDEPPPRFEKTTWINDVPEIKAPPHLEAKKAEANVKPVRSSLFDLVPNLMGKSARAARKAEKQKASEAPAFEAADEQLDLPAFLRRQK